MFILSVRDVFIIFKKYCSNFKSDNSFIKLFIKSIQIVMAQSINHLFDNLSQIFSSLKKILVLILVLPVTYYIIKIQIFVGIFFVLFYLSTFIIFHVFLKSSWIMTCGNINGYVKRHDVYTILKVVIFIPRAKAYLLVYKLLIIFYNKKENFLRNHFLLKCFFCLFIMFTMSLILNFSLILMLGYSYLIIIVASRFVLKFFRVIPSLSYDMRILYELTLINCFCDINYSTLMTAGQRILFSEEQVIFNG